MAGPLAPGALALGLVLALAPFALEYGVSSPQAQPVKMSGATHQAVYFRGGPPATQRRTIWAHFASTRC